VAEQRAALAAMDDLALEGALRDLSTALAYPSAGAAGADVATRVRLQLHAAPPASARSSVFGWIGRRPVRRGLLLAIAALLVLAAVAGAVGLGLPGIRILFGGPTPSVIPAPSSPIGSPVGQGLGLGTLLPIDDAGRLAGLDLVLPPDQAVGPPDAAYLLRNRVALVWSERPGLPADPSSGVGLLISEFGGSLDDGYYQKLLEGDARITPVTVNDGRGFWISGPQHFFYYVDPSGAIVEDTRRSVGDTLIWTDGDVTYRLESRLGMEEAIQLAESLR
jgi:hypothetical protein